MACNNQLLRASVVKLLPVAGVWQHQVIHVPAQSGLALIKQCAQQVQRVNRLPPGESLRRPDFLTGKPLGRRAVGKPGLAGSLSNAPPRIFRAGLAAGKKRQLSVHRKMLHNHRRKFPAGLHHKPAYLGEVVGSAVRRKRVFMGLQGFLGSVAGGCGYVARCINPGAARRAHFGSDDKTSALASVAHCIRVLGSCTALSAASRRARRLRPGSPASSPDGFC